MNERNKDTQVEIDAGPSVGLTNMIGAGLSAMLHSAEPLMVGKRLGAYRVVRILGQGGMGVVFLAERDDEQYQQRVAIKLVSDIALSPEVLARFKSERQILARLRHPYIAHLIDGGETDSGVPFLVMEYIEGEPIIDACRLRKLNLDQRLTLFLKICEAVHFAHQHLIVHRDLKSGNILVTPEGFPKLLDFGIAKILDRNDPDQLGARADRDQTVYKTEDGRRLLTPDHAAPEQVLGQPITTATDVYCLGILLYELLTGCRPYTLDSTRPGQLERVICETPTPPPSAMLTRTLRDKDIDELDLPLPLERLRRRLRGDLDNIALKTLRKEPERRYVSAYALAEDIRRYRNGLPVEARPDTFGYRAGKFVRRHVFGVATATAMIAMLAVFAVAMTVQARRIERERQAAVQTSSFLIDMFRSPDPYEARGQEIKAVDLLERATVRIDRDLAGQPQLQATLMNTMGVVYKRLGVFDEAEPLLSDALERKLAQNDDPESRVRYQSDLGEVLIEKARYDEAIALFTDALEYGRTHLGRRHRQIARALTGLGNALMETGEYETAEAHFAAALAMDRQLLDADDPGIAASLDGLGAILHRRAKLNAARAALDEALTLRRRRLGNDHPLTVESVNNLAAVLIDAGDYDGAQTLFREALTTNTRVLGADHPTVGINLNNLGYVLLSTGRFADAEPVYRRALAIDRAALGDDHPELAYSLNSLAMTLAGSDQHAEAEALYREALALLQEQTEFEHRLLGQVHANYATLLGRLEKHDEAHSHAVLAKEKIDAEYPDDHWRRAFADSVLGGALAALGRVDEARPLLEQSIAPISGSMGKESVYAKDARKRLAALDAEPDRTLR